MAKESKEKFESSVYWGKKEPKEPRDEKKKSKKAKKSKGKKSKDKKAKKDKKAREYVIYVETGGPGEAVRVDGDEASSREEGHASDAPETAGVPVPASDVPEGGLPEAEEEPKPAKAPEPDGEPDAVSAEPDAASEESPVSDGPEARNPEREAEAAPVQVVATAQKWDPGKTAVYDALAAPSRDGDDDELAEAAIQMLKEAAAAGDPSAMRSLGNRYLAGNGVPQDFTLMREWWERAAQAGNTTAMWDLGYYYVIGMYLDQDISRGVAWFRLAVENGNANAAFQLGLFYGTGMFVEKNLDEALRWFKEAQRLGREDAREEIDECERILLEGATEESGKGPRGGNIEIEHLSRKFGRKVVLNDITLTIKGGELVAIVGSSGGGKSTLGSIILGTLRPSKGRVTFGGSLGFVPQQNLVHEYLTVRQQLDFYARSVKHLQGDEARERKAWVLRELGLEDVERTLIRRCSGGEKRRVSVACELLSSPEGLLLDEPTSGLDPGDSGNLVAVLHGLVHNNRMTVLVINHDYENIQLFDKIVFLAHGKVCFYGTPDKLFEYFDTTSTREIYTLMDKDPDPFIRRFEEWRTSHPEELGGIC